MRYTIWSRIILRIVAEQIFQPSRQANLFVALRLRLTFGMSFFFLLCYPLKIFYPQITCMTPRVSNPFFEAFSQLQHTTAQHFSYAYLSLKCYS